MKYISFLLSLYFLISFSKSSKFNDNSDDNPDPGYENLLKWGLSHNLTMTSKIKFIKSKSTKQYIAKNLIPEDDVIMDIPPSCMLNINSTLTLLNSKKFFKAFLNYVEAEKLSTEVMKDEYHVDQAFMSYVLYIVNKKPKYYSKNNFYKYYSPMFYIFEQNLDNLPFYFSSEQMRFFLNTSFGSVFEIFNKYIQEESFTFEKKIFNKSIEYEEYLKYRIFSMQKSYEVNKTINIVPFIDYIKKDFKKINCEFNVSDNGHIIIKAKENIFPGEELIMNPAAISNQHRFTFFGETFDEIKDKFNTFNIPSLIPNYITDKNVIFDLESFGNKARVDLVEIDFYKSIMFVYKKFAKLINEDDSDIGACNLMLKYLKRIRSNYEYINKDEVRKAFFSQKDIDNVLRIIEGEKLFIDRRISLLMIHIKNLKERMNRKVNYDAEDVNDL